MIPRLPYAIVLATVLVGQASAGTTIPGKSYRSNESAPNAYAESGPSAQKASSGHWKFPGGAKSYPVWVPRS